MKNLDILSRVYGLLAEHSGDDFSQAAATPGVGPEVVRILEALGKARRLLVAQEGNEPPEVLSPDEAEAEDEAWAPVGRPTRLGAAPAPAASPGRKGEVLSEMEHLLVDQAVFNSNKDLVTWLESLQLPLQFRYREGRPRIVKKFLSFAESQPAAKQKSILKKLQKKINTR